tara:strand:- start:2006 stop:3145 length:1140 start_codon:yes stop_codon:yes gene_type:complete
MADKLFFSRDTQVFLVQGSSTWNLPVLDGFSFSQGTNTSEITLNEMATSTGVSRRGRQMFTDSYAPAEWSFSTYIRPFVSAGTGTGAADTAIKTHAVEEALWSNFVGAGTYASSTFSDITNDNEATGMSISFASSNKVTLGTFDLFFLLSKTSGNATDQLYKIAGCVVNEASIDFDIDGIATINWSGMGGLISEVEGGVVPNLSNVIKEGTASTDTANFIRNRLTSLAITNGAGGKFQSSYDVVLTGGNITMNNNMTFLTPETLGVVNQPLGHVTGTRSVGGSFTAYLGAGDTGDNSTADLFEDIIESTDVVTNDFELVFSIGGHDATPGVVVTMNTCHLEVPTHSMDDVISLEVNFHALPSTIGEKDEATITYKGTTL